VVSAKSVAIRQPCTRSRRNWSRAGTFFSVRHFCAGNYNHNRIVRERDRQVIQKMWRVEEEPNVIGILLHVGLATGGDGGKHEW